MLKGLGVSAGIEIGRVHVIKNFNFNFDQALIKADKVDSELERFVLALHESEKQLIAFLETISQEIEIDKYEIFLAHIEIVRDPLLSEKIENKIKEDLMTAERAVSIVIEEFAVNMEAMEDDYFKNRAPDIRDVGNRIVRNLLGLPVDLKDELEEEVIVVAEDLTPSTVANLDRSKVKAFVTGSGGKTSHVSIIARGMGIPAVVGLGLEVNLLLQGDLIIVDGGKGIVINSKVDESVLKEYSELRENQLHAASLLEVYKDKPCITSCGAKEVEVCANISFPEECADVFKYGGEGVGLYRTEFLFMDQKSWPNEEKQFQEYKAVVEKMAPLSVTARTLDIGGDKNLCYMEIPFEENPFLGLRALRLCCAKPDIFLTQLRALLRASVYGKMKIMFPMVSSVDEVRKAKEYLQRAKDQLEERNIPYDKNIKIGIMVEIPAAAILAERLAQEVDFFSIGTNDLIQYTVAADRMNKEVAHLYDYFNPAVLLLIKNVIDASHKYGKWTGMCGEMAGSLEAVALLIGMGLDEFSMSPASIPRFKQQLSTVTYENAQKLADTVMSLDTAEKIREIVAKGI